MATNKITNGKLFSTALIFPMPCGCPTLTIENDNKNLFVYLEGPATKPYICAARVPQ